MNNKNQKPNNQNNGNIDETVEKAKSEINAQTDSMLREIEERRQRRLARQREMEQQIQAEEEAKARRLARLKAQEAANADLKWLHPTEILPMFKSLYRPYLHQTVFSATPTDSSLTR